MAVGDIFLLRATFRSHARIWSINQHYVDATGQTDLLAAQDLTDRWDADYKAGMLAEMAADTTFESLYSVKLTGGDAMPSLKVLPSPPGTVTGRSLPPNTAVVVSLGSTDVNLIRPGRLYVAGIPHSKILNGNLTAAYLITFKAAWEAIAKTVITTGGGNWQPVIYLTVLAGAPRVPTIGANVDSVRVKPILYTQRRRNSRQQGTT
ncbi:unnamed protein product [marine sediment metagenome]|uniref:Uncharacterized protein n=1 Tax=marine sediment metagenome TaxID=412755 RepID=X1A5L2_9ZZZZ